MNRKVFFILPFVLISLVLGTYNGLIRMGWMFPGNNAVAQHGAIMVGSFLCSVILLERIVNFRKTFLYIFPLINSVSVIFFLTGKFIAGLQLLFIGGIALAGIFIYLYSMYRELYTLIMLIGTLSLLAGYLMLMNSHFYPASVSFWFAFLLLLVTGERMELTKFLPVSKSASSVLLICISLFFIGLVFNFHGSGHLLTGFSMMLMALWLIRYDVAVKSLRMPGLHRYIAFNLLAGFVWLLVTGLLLFFKPSSVYMYDATIHAFFLGFTFSMIFAHGPVIYPGIAGIPKRAFHVSLYLWCLLLQFSLVIRLFADFDVLFKLRELSGLLNVIALLGFFIHLFLLMKNSPHKQAI